MVFDEFRNERYAQAIRACVTPESTVLDLGAGLGVLGLIAAAAGARRVYLVEPEAIVRLAPQVAQANGLSDRITVLQGTVEEITLPERVDVIVSVFTGNLLFTEDLLPSLFFARDRFLKPGGYLIPDAAELIMAPIAARDGHNRYVSRWSQPVNGLDFSAVRNFAGNELFGVDRSELQVERLGDGVTMTSIDLAAAADANCLGRETCRIQKSGECHALLGWIRIRLGAEWLATGPDDPPVHWSPMFLPLDPPLMLVEGEDVTLSIQRPVGGDWTWSIEAQSGTRRHSTFLGQADSLQRLQAMRPDHRPGLGWRGEIRLQALTLMREGRTNQEIAQALFDANPARFVDINDALQLTRRLATRHGRQEGR